jgi:flagellar biosynthesis/type III secretory pathway M-ring protein FliF/YscJ
VSAKSAQNGHNRREERGVAKQLYIAIVAAVVAGIFLFMMVGQKPEMNPLDHERPADVQPGSR